jgi:hypothetical protein
MEMNSVNKQLNRLRNILIFMWLYAFVVYLPFFIYMTVSHDVARVSMSNIAWIVGYKRHLIIYLILSFPFLLFQLSFLNRMYAGNNAIVRAVSAVSCVFIIIGAFVPLRIYEQYAWMNTVHTYLSVGGTIVFMLTIMVALVLHAVKWKLNVAVFLFYGIFVAALLVAFIILSTAALFQLMATLCFMLVLLVVNTVSVERFTPTSSSQTDHDDDLEVLVE